MKSLPRLLSSAACTVAALCLAAASPALAQRGMNGLKAPGSVALSPDGQTVAWTLRSREGSALHLMQVADPAKDTTIAVDGDAKCAYGTPIWSPDGQTLAFLASCTAPSADPTVPRQEQLYLWSKSTGQVRQLTHLIGEVEQPAWSPDGKSIAFLFVENATRSAGALDAMKPWAGVIGEDGVEVQRVYAVDSTSGTGGFLTPANLHVYEFDWAPSSHEIAFIGAVPPGSNNWWVAKLYTTVVTSGSPAEPTALFDPNTTHTALHGLQIAVPRWSPDGKRIALIGGLMSDQGSTGGDLWVIDAKDGRATDVTPGIDGTPCFETWINDKELGFVEDRRGHTLLVDWNPDTKKQIIATDLGEVLVSGGPLKDAISYSRNGIYAFAQRSHTAGPELWAGAPDSLKPLTHLNASYKPDVKVESIEWRNEGFNVQGWLTLPKDYDPHKSYPLIVQVHGGPSASVFGGTSWAELGYFEFEPNPRGSFGQGEAFTEANRKDFGYGDLRDILKGMDVIEARYPIDKHREGITGWSYGGFMTMFAVTQTHRFRAAVAGAGLSDWLSYYGENSIDQWMIPFFGASVYDDPAVYAKSSPITFIKNAKTPMLIVVGDRDGECPAPQSFEMWHALRDLGVKTQLVVYPDEGHGFRNPEHQRDVVERSIRWFADNMPPDEGNGKSQAVAAGK